MTWIYIWFHFYSQQDQMQTVEYLMPDIQYSNIYQQIRWRETQRRHHNEYSPEDASSHYLVSKQGLSQSSGLLWALCEWYVVSSSMISFVSIFDQGIVSCNCHISTSSQIPMEIYKHFYECLANLYLCETLPKSLMNFIYLCAKF